MESKTVIIIDTDTETIQKIMSTLESKGYLVFTASSKDISITLANKVKPSLIFVNIGISGTSGLEICKAIHEIKTLENVPIIIITPHEETIDQRYTSLYGIVDFLKKPFAPEELITKTRDVLATKSIEQPVKEEVITEPVEEEIDIQLFEEAKISAEAKEGVEVQPVEEGLTVQPIEEDIDIQLLEEEEITAEPVKEGIEIKPIEEDIDAQLLEEQIELGKDEYPTTLEEKASDIQKEAREEIVLEEFEEKQMTEEMDKEKGGQIVIEEPEENLSEPDFISQKRDSLYRSRKGKKENGKKNRLFVPVIVIVAIAVVAAGVVLYKSFMQETKIQKPVIVTPSKPIEQQAAKVEPPKVEPSPVQQKPQQVIVEKKPAPPSAPPPKMKPEGKPMYSVQIGIFRNEANAIALTKKYKNSGYDVFTQKSTAKDKGILYRVLIGKFGNKKEATRFAKNIRDKEKINVIIFRE
jgi:DNA-binding response OmpR family regulator